MARTTVNTANVKCALTVDRRSGGHGHRAILAAFWPHNSAQCCRLLRISEQYSTRSAGE
jgi:hypothetical protein